MSGASGASGAPDGPATALLSASPKGRTPEDGARGPGAWSVSQAGHTELRTGACGTSQQAPPEGWAGSRSADGDLRRSPLPAAREPLLLGQLHGLVDEGLHDLRLGDGRDHLAPDEDLALAVARGHAQVGLARPARAVDHAAHDRHPDRK